MDDTAIVALARQQHGLVTTGQAIALGATYQAIGRRVAKGWWRYKRRGVIEVGATPSTWEQAVMGACLAGGQGTLASHRTAARMWGFVHRSGRIEVLCPEGRRIDLSGITNHRSYLVAPMDVATLNGIPVTAPARTIVDAAPGQLYTVVGAWIDQALRQRTMSLLDLTSCLARLAGPGRPSTGNVRRALTLRLPGYDPGDSDLEVRVMQAIIRAKLPPPVQQHRIMRGDGVLAFVDLAYPEAKIAIELDGWDAHGTRTAFDGDRVRANELTLLGWRVLRFTSTTPDAVIVRTIRAALAASGDAA